MSGFTRAVLALTGSRPVERLVRGTKAGRFLAERFVAGDTLDDGIRVVHRLAGDGLAASLDLLGEEVTHRDAALAARGAYAMCLQRIAAEGLDANISVKLTQLGLAIDEGLAAESLVLLAEEARRAGTTVTVDMEGSRFTEATVSLYAAAQAETGNLGLALQAYLYRTPSDLARLAPLGGHIRLCKGAYAEPAEIAVQERSEVEAAFVRLLEMLMGYEEVRPAVATHDQRLIDITRSLARRRSSPFEFQMLFGVRPNLQRALVDDGFAVRVYVPFGSHWYPYLTRRLAERPANAALFVRALASRAGPGRLPVA